MKTHFSQDPGEIPKVTPIYSTTPPENKEEIQASESQSPSRNAELDQRTHQEGIVQIQRSVEEILHFKLVNEPGKISYKVTFLDLISMNPVLYGKMVAVLDKIIQREVFADRQKEKFEKYWNSLKENFHSFFKRLKSNL